ncbi:carboxyltransferase domain-containing protein [uncultured Cyclobacterium sp.]|uniref:5-oxoprolinase subunit B family protein n=1 Tax=uncultured Cyclobacterium sp. TaxID=453820 RepID=UPI0030EE349D|tara:strand:+ start:28836 stop:29555 length:720 start_codon:yes stop_codon:yes gene_type:complete
MKYPVKIFSQGPRIIELNWPEIISEDVLMEIIVLKNSIENQWHLNITSIYHSYQVLSIQLKEGAPTAEFIAWVKSEIQHPLESHQLPQRWVWTVPVCYDPEVAPSQSKYLEEKNMDLDTLVALHTSQSFLLYFYGFLPGFMYLGGLPEPLHIKRKKIPDRKISQGSVAIGGSQTGIYPVDSPGGWYVVGKTPVLIFENGKINLPFNPGDKIQFAAISQQRYMEIQEGSIHHWEKEPYFG